MKRYLTGKVFLFVLLATPAHAQQMQTTTTYSASVVGARDCTAINLTVTRTQTQDATRTWVSFTIRQCAVGGSDPYVGPIVAQASQVIPDGDYSIGRTVESLKTATSAGAVSLTWTATTQVHQTYQAQWTNDTNGSTTKQQEASDTKSATPTGTIAGYDVGGRSGYVITATSASGSK